MVEFIHRESVPSGITEWARRSPARTRRAASARPRRSSISASYLALAGERVLVVDLDPQGNATSGLGFDRSSIERSVYDAVVDGVEHRRPDRAGPVDGLDVVPSAIALAGAEVELAPVEGRERRLARLLAEIADRLRLHPHRLPAVARPADRQRPDRRRLRAHPAPMRVLRPGRTDPAACHDRPRPRPPEPGPRDQRASC